MVATSPMPTFPTRWTIPRSWVAEGARTWASQGDAVALPAQSPSGGAPAWAGTDSSMLTHGWALEHQMFICGSSQDGSSSVTAISHSHPGVTATSATTGEPHRGQNLRVTGWPLPPKCSKADRPGPSNRRLPFGRTTRTEKAELVCRGLCALLHHPKG